VAELFKSEKGDPKNRAKYLQSILSDMKKFRKDKYDEKWNESLRWFKGEQKLRSEGLSRDFRSDTVTNFLFAHIMTTTPTLARRLPVVSVTPFTKEFKVQARELESLVRRIFVHNDFASKQTQAVTNGLLFGRGFYKPIFNPKMRGSTGDIQITVPDTRGIYKDKLWVGDSSLVFECRQLDKLTLYQMYPDKKRQIDRAFRKDVTQKQEDSYQSDNTGEVGYRAYKTDDVGGGTQGDNPPSSQAYVWDVAANKEKDHQTVEFVEAWIVDETTIQNIKDIKDDKLRKRFKKDDFPMRPYPTGRLVAMIGTEIIDDRPNPFPRFPYVEWDNYCIPGEIYGHGDLEQLKPIQEQYNIRSNQIFDGLNFATFPITFYDHTSGLEPEEIENKPGGYYPVEDIKGIQRFDPTGVSSGAFQSLPQLEHVFEVISGSREVSQGEVPGDVRSGYAVEQLQELAQNRLSLKTQSLEYAIKNVVSYITDMIGLFYIPGVHYTDEVDLKGISADMFDFEVRAGINLPQSKFAQRQDQWKMLESGVVDRKYMLDNSDIHDKEEIENRMMPLWEAEKQALLSQANQMGGVPNAATSAEFTG
jgi:hypothetical protein